MDKIKSYEDACKALGIDPNNLPDVSAIPEEHQRSFIAQYKLTIIAQALNEGWKPDWNDWRQTKYFPWFQQRPAGFAYDGWTVADTRTNVGSRLCFKTSTLAEYAGQQFTDLYNDYLTF